MSGHELLLNIGGGVALLLWATRMVRTGVMRAFGADLRRHLGRSTRSRPLAFAMGTLVASLLQSSTATALLAVSFAGRGLITVAAGLAMARPRAGRVTASLAQPRLDAEQGGETIAKRA